jgi:hypothetical protein
MFDALLTPPGSEFARGNVCLPKGSAHLPSQQQLRMAKDESIRRESVSQSNGPIPDQYFNLRNQTTTTKAPRDLETHIHLGGEIPKQLHLSETCAKLVNKR